MNIPYVDLGLALPHLDIINGRTAVGQVAVMITVITVVHSHQNLQTGISSLEENPEVSSGTLLRETA